MIKKGTKSLKKFEALTKKSIVSSNLALEKKKSGHPWCRGRGYE